VDTTNFCNKLQRSSFPP